VTANYDLVMISEILNLKEQETTIKEFQKKIKEFCAIPFADLK